MVGPGGALAAAPRHHHHRLLLLMLCFLAGGARASPATDALRHASPRAAAGGLCQQLLLPQGYPCTEHTVQTDDGFLLSVQHIPHGKNRVANNAGPPVFLQHGLFQGGDTWFINSNEQSLGYILADNGFDVWIGNVRGTRWSKGHSTLSVHDKLFWDWSWQDLAEYDLLAMLSYVYTVAQSKILYVGHSQGTIMGLAAFTNPEIVKMISSAALLCPISYLDHVSASFVLRAVAMHLDQVIYYAP
jgi:lysosomal acid lipase/cholesteryl ester hydrolase